MTVLHYDERDLPAVGAVLSKAPTSLRQDASAFTARQLEYVRAKTYDKKMPVLRALQLIPVISEAPEWAETITYGVFDQVGIAKIVANYADDLPRADVARKEISIRVKDIGDSYGYNVNELAASVALGTNLPTRKAEAARRAVEIKVNQIALAGEPAYGLYGLATHPNIGTTAITGGWTSATATSVILADLNAVYDAVRTQSNGVHTPTRIALPTAEYSLITTTARSDTSDKTIAEFWLGNHPGVSFLEMPELTDELYCGEFIADNIGFEQPMAFNQLPAQERNLELVVPCRARVAGVSVFYPLALTKASL